MRILKRFWIWTPRLVLITHMMRLRSRWLWSKDRRDPRLNKLILRIIEYQTRWFRMNLHSSSELTPIMSHKLFIRIIPLWASLVNYINSHQTTKQTSLSKPSPKVTEKLFSPLIKRWSKRKFPLLKKGTIKENITKSTWLETSTAVPKVTPWSKPIMIINSKIKRQDLATSIRILKRWGVSWHPRTLIGVNPSMEMKMRFMILLSWIRGHYK